MTHRENCEKKKKNLCLEKTPSIDLAKPKSGAHVSLFSRPQHWLRLFRRDDFPASFKAINTHASQRYFEAAELKTLVDLRNVWSQDYDYELRFHRSIGRWVHMRPVSL